LATGFAWNGQLGLAPRVESLGCRFSAASYGGAAPVTLDEVALWLNLEDDDYWTRQVRRSIDAVTIMGSSWPWPPPTQAGPRGGADRRGAPGRTELLSGP
jgi:hypothetical protein